MRRSLAATGPAHAPDSTAVVRGPCSLTVPFEMLAVDGENRCWIWQVGPPVPPDPT